MAAHTAAGPATSAGARVASLPRVHGDFNGDGFADLAIGVPNGDRGRGAVVVLYGGSAGLSTSFGQYWVQEARGVAGPAPAPGDQFGYAVAPGDYNHDGFADLAIGVPGKSAVIVLYGSPGGLTAQHSEYLPSSDPNGSGGLALAAGDFNGDGRQDLAVGEPFASGRKPAMGMVEIHDGSDVGLGAAAAQRFSESTPGVPGPNAGISDNFGLSLASGAFRGQRPDGLAIGVLGQNGVIVLDGSGAGLTTIGSQFLPGYGEGAGSSLASGDFNGDGLADLAVGEPTSVAVSDEAGILEIHYGSAAGLTDAGFGTAQSFAEVSAGMPGPGPQASDHLGLAVATGDFNGDGFVDLAAGAPGKSAAVVLYGSAAGLSTTGSQFIAARGPLGAFSLAAADFRGIGYTDLVVGDPFHGSTPPQAGAVEIHDGSGAGVTALRGAGARLFTESTRGMPGPAAAAYDNFGFAVGAGDAGRGSSVAGGGPP